MRDIKTGRFLKGTDRPIINDFSINTKECNYWAGFLFGDGSIDTKNKLFVCLSIKDVDHLVKLSQYICGHDYVLRYKDRCIFQITSPKIIQNLSRFGIIPNKTYKGTLQLPKVNTWDFIRGYFDADGWVTVRNSLIQKKYIYEVYSMGICSYLRQNLDIINEYMNLQGSLRKCKNRELYELRFAKKTIVLQLSQQLYHPITSLERKRQKIWYIIQKLSGSNSLVA